MSKEDHSSIDAEKIPVSPPLEQFSASTDLESDTKLSTFADPKKLDKEVEELAAELGIDQKKLMWKIDLCVVPPLALLYFLAFLDRVNISNAKVLGLPKALGLKGDQFNTALTLFFVPYIFFEVLSNYCIKIVRPHIWLSGCIFLFGIVTIGMGFVKNFGGLAACRFLLGIFESGSFPAIFYILANFYTPKESQRRFSTFFSCTCLAGAAGGAIAYKIRELNGKYGISSWQWVFIVEGSFTAGLAFVLFFIIPNFPENSRFLSSNESAFIKRKLEIYTSSHSGFEVHNTLKDVLNVFKDPMIWITAIAYFSLIIPAYGYAYFATSIISAMGYTGNKANQMSVYPWVCAFGFSIIVSFISDFTKIRTPYAIFSSLLAIVGLAMVLGCDSIHARYGACFLTACGLYTAMPILVCWSSLNYGGHLRKGVGSSFLVGFGNIGGIISTYIFLAREAPKYVVGLSVSIAFTAFSIVCMLIYLLYVIKQNSNKQKESYQTKYYSLSEEEKIKQGDRNPAFKYLY